MYKATTIFPADERFGLVSQMRRAAVSVVANIVEGSKRKTVKDRSNFHTIADGSLEELKYYMILAASLGFIDQDRARELSESARDVGAMLRGLTNSLTRERTA